MATDGEISIQYRVLAEKALMSLRAALDSVILKELDRQIRRKKDPNDFSEGLAVHKPQDFEKYLYRPTFKSDSIKLI